MFDNLTNNWDYVKSYKTIAGLEKALVDNNLDKDHPIMIMVPHGKNANRFTAIFQSQKFGHDPMYPVRHGFKTI
jgi:hypothetical protein